MATKKEVVPMDVMTSALGNAFRSERLIYRALEDNDADLDFIFTHLESDPVTAALSNPSIHRPVSKKVIDERFKLLIKTAMLATMVCLPDGPSGEPTPIGYVSVKEYLPFQRRGLLGIQISPAYQNKGYGTEVINWAIDWAFRWGGLHSLALGASLYNERAVSVYRKAGFKQEGVSREAVYRDRKWHDVVQMAILENEWEELRGLAKGRE
ncbi:acyl-CoA N-acyltransferase [Nemania sp. NC0429]|nr:acyl-CoA N-acyltransferase [Nemania sp. NC0429]